MLQQGDSGKMGRSRSSMLGYNNQKLQTAFDSNERQKKAHVTKESRWCWTGDEEVLRPAHKKDSILMNLRRKKNLAIMKIS